MRLSKLPTKFFNPSGKLYNLPDPRPRTLVR